MVRNRFIYLIFFLLGILSLPGFTQSSSIEGIVNVYTAIDTIYCFDDNNVDSLIVTDVSGFGVDDTVMVYCVVGAAIETTDIFGEDQIGRDAQNPRNSGKYAFLIVDEIDVPRKLVVLNTTVRPEINPLGDGELAQLIKVPSYRSATITAAGVTAPAWNGSTGGIVTLFVHGALYMNGDITVSGKGFKGAIEGVDYGGDCSVVDTALYDSAFYLNTNIRAGKKGEGTTDTRFDRLRGRAMNINGGGGGNGLFSGGGGGSNFSSGGNGGNESSSCAPGVQNPGGRGGFDLSRPGAYYINGNSLNRGNRIFFGGGGGTGTRMPAKTTTNGADGGGLVVIVADTIIGNNRWIYADGNDVTGTATGAAGGGGGGGGIILDVSGYKTALNLSAVGGKGGDTFDSDTTGPGGGGGGGVYWMAEATQPGVNALLFNNGASGEHLSVPAINFGATDGGVAGKRTNLEAPLRGFLFNSVPSEFTVCSDQLPDPILASVPKGGNGPGSYNYQWVDSSSTQNFWDVAPGVSNQQNYTFPAPLSDTTYFRRVVTSGILPADTSFRIAVYVHPAITNNTVSAPDTVCKGDAPQLFVPSATIGGGPTGGSYTYQWRKNEGSGYADADGTSTGESYQAPGLDVTTDFTRITYSGVCIDTSSVLKVQVWEPLTDNDITPYDTICYSTVPDQIGGPEPGQGDPADKRYQWESAALAAGPWSEINGATSQNYQSTALTQTTWFRRVALSGSDDACVDISSPVEVLNIPLITGNTITETQTVCTFDRPELLNGSDPGGGYQGLYSYEWQSRTLSSTWSPATGIIDVKSGYNAGVMDGDTTWYRRVVGSGGAARNVCLDPSDSIAIHVLPSITNNVITTSDAIKCQWDLLEDLTQDVSGGSTPGGGATQGGNDPTRIYKWEVATGLGTPGAWQVINGAEAINYADRPQLDTELDRFFRRIVFSGPSQVCKDTTGILQVTVHTQITTNSVEPFDSVCFATTKLLLGSTPVGEPGLTPVYTWQDLDTGSDIPGSDQEDFTTSAYNNLGSYNYQRAVQIGQCSDTSNAMQITVMQLPGGHLTDAAYRACEKDTLFSIDLNMDLLDTYVSPWEVYLKNEENTGIGPILIAGDGGLAHTLDIDTDSIQLNYEIESITYRSVGDRYACTSPGDSLSGLVPVHVFRRPEPRIRVDQTERDSFKVCNTTVTLEGFADNGISSWSSDPPGTVFFSPEGGADTYFASIPNNHVAYGKYLLTFSSEAGDCAGVDSIDIHYFEQPDPAFAGNDTMIFLNNTIQLNADSATAGIGTWEVVTGNARIDDPNAHNTFASDLALGVDNENKFRWTITNGEDEGTCVTSADVVIVIRNEVKRYQGFSPDGDDFNEYFIMQGLKYADEFTIHFFNALGKPVAEITHETISELDVVPALVQNGLREDEMVVWDGRSTFNGNLVPSGTYYYVVSFVMYQRDPITENVTGEVTYEDVVKDYVVVVR